MLALLAGCELLVPPDSGGLPAGAVSADEVERSRTNHAPQSAAGDDQAVVSGALVTLTGVGSTDQDGDQLSFVWRQVGGSPRVEIENGFGAIARFQAPAGLSAATTLVFSLTVTDGFAATVDQMQVTIQP